VREQRGGFSSGLLEERAALRRSGIRCERLLWLDREADRDISGTVESLENLAAEQAPIFSLHAGAGRQFDSAITGVAGGTGEVRFLHDHFMPRLRAAFQPGSDTFPSYKVHIFGK
jgi:hypothetical protein